MPRPFRGVVELLWGEIAMVRLTLHELPSSTFPRKPEGFPDCLPATRRGEDRQEIDQLSGLRSTPLRLGRCRRFERLTDIFALKNLDVDDVSMILWFPSIVYLR